MRLAMANMTTELLRVGVMFDNLTGS